MEIISENTAIFWMLFGAALLAAEVFLAPGIGFLFAGFAGITVGGLIALGVMTGSIPLQIAGFLGFTVFWAMLLWKPIKMLRVSKSTETYSDFEGKPVVVNSNSVKRTGSGLVMWSGSIFNAKVSKNSGKAEFAKGEEAFIESIEGTTLIITDKKNGE